METAETVNEVQNGEVQTQEEEESNVVTATKEVNGETRKGSVVWDPGADLDEAAEKYGKETVYDLYRRAAIIKLQAGIRARLEQGAEQAAIESEFGNWRPDEDRKPTRDPKQAILNNFNKLSLEEREALIKQLRGES